MIENKTTNGDFNDIFVLSRMRVCAGHTSNNFAVLPSVLCVLYHESRFIIDRQQLIRVCRAKGV